MRLSAYLAEKQVSDADFAAAIGVSRQAVHRYKTGERVPEWAILSKIKESTAGAVSPDDFLEPTSEPAEAAE